MAVVKPTKDQLRRIAEHYHLELTEEELGAYRNLMEAALTSYSRLEQLAEPKLSVKYPRTPGYRPSIDENKLGAWYWKTSIKGEPEGPLSGKKIVIKDNICVAGVPMMNGSAILEGYTPDVDATVVTRVLEAGGEIIGKAVCEHLCLSAGSHTADTGPVRNPHNLEHSSGGSSSGSAVLVATGEADMAIGGDQSGSIRLPSSWCGVVGFKPTFGLVPYTGAFPIEQTLDHLGPIARTVSDAALLLHVIAGPDGFDPRQSNLSKKDYLGALDRDIKGMRIGIVKEGLEVSEPDVNELVRAGAECFTELGAKVEEVSIPMHHDGIHIWNAIACEGILSLMVRGNGMGNNWKGYYTTSLMDAYGRGRMTRSNDYSPTVKLVILLGQYMETFYHGRYYAKAQNLALTLTQAYDDAFKKYDILLMPTAPQKATRIPDEGASVEEKVASALNMIYNTCPFNVTGHPAISVPCGFSQGLPVGMMLVGRKGEDDTVLQAAHAFEKIGSAVKG